MAEFARIESTAAQAEALLAQGRLVDAERHYRELIGATHVIDYEYDDWLRRLADIYRQLQRYREAGFIYLYLHYFDNAADAFHGDDTGRALVLEVRASDAVRDERARLWNGAAELYLSVRRPVHAAVCAERAENYGEAARLWEQVLKQPALRDSSYELALAHFNYGMSMSRLDDESGAGRRALIDSQRKLEQVADDFETRGERERAFDCYQILLKLGKDSGQFENLAEGYLNCIRVLKEDGLKFYVLQYYEDFIKLALERGELHAAATLYQEAADYAARTGLPYDRHYQAMAAETWARCGEKFLADGAPVELAENAMVAAISCFSSVGNYVEVRRLFHRLSEIDLPEKSRRRYQNIANHYSDAIADGRDAPEFPEYLKQQHAYADIWFVDLVEWELGGDPHAVAASIIGNLRYPDGIRRRALVVVLMLADAAARGEETEPETLARAAELLGELQSYAALCPLERLYEHGDARVRRAAVRSLRFLFFKRSFILIRRALQDGDPTVRDAAVDALRGLHFPHAFNPLARIFRESEDPRVQAVALESIGRIQSIEAGEFLLKVLRQEEGALRDTAKRALSGFDNVDLLPILRQHAQIESNPEVRSEMEELVRSARG